jgi:hypothetical protein
LEVSAKTRYDATVTYLFLGDVGVEAYMLLRDVHVPLQQDALEQPAGILGYDLFFLVEFEDLL